MNHMEWRESPADPAETPNAWGALKTNDREALFWTALDRLGKLGRPWQGWEAVGCWPQGSCFLWACACAHYGFFVLPHSTRVLEPGGSSQAPRACARALAALARAHAKRQIPETPAGPPKFQARARARLQSLRVYAQHRSPDT